MNSGGVSWWFRILGSLVAAVGVGWLFLKPRMLHTKRSLVLRKPCRPSSGFRWGDVSPSLRRKVAAFIIEQPHETVVHLAHKHPDICYGMAHGKLCVLDKFSCQVFVFNLAGGNHEYRWLTPLILHEWSQMGLHVVQQPNCQTRIVLRRGPVFTMHSWNGQLLRQVEMEMDLLTGLYLVTVTDTVLVLTYKTKIHVVCAHTGRLLQVLPRTELHNVVADAHGYVTCDYWNNTLTASAWNGTSQYVSVLDLPEQRGWPNHFMLTELNDCVLVASVSDMHDDETRSCFMLVRRADGVVVNLWDVAFSPPGRMHMDLPNRCVYCVTELYQKHLSSPVRIWIEH